MKQPSHWDALFTPGRSLNIVSYELEYTEDLTQEFDQSMPVSADMIDNAGNVTIELPPSEQLFIQLKMVIP